MTKAQQIQVRLSECRQKLNELLGVETRSPEQQSELESLTGEVQKLEPEFRAAMAAETGKENEILLPDAEERAYQDLLSRANLGTAVGAALECRQADGAEGELAQHHGLPANMIALDLLRDPSPAPETRRGHSVAGERPGHATACRPGRLRYRRCCVLERATAHRPGWRRRVSCP